MTVPYGSEADVAALANLWTLNNVFTTATNPKLAQVTLWLADVSDMLDLALANNGFTIPVDTGITNYVKIVNLFSSQVVPLVADLCHAANGSGRFFTDRAILAGQNSPAGQMKAIERELNAWVYSYIDGLVKLGLTRTLPETSADQMVVRFI